MGKSLLTLDTLEPDRDFIAIDGKEYFLRSDGELSLSQMARIRKLAADVNELGKAVDMSEADAEKLESYIGSVLDLVVIDLISEIRDKLRQDQKLAIVSAFTAAASLRRAEAKAAEIQPITVD